MERIVCGLFDTFTIEKKLNYVVIYCGTENNIVANAASKQE